MLDFMCIIIFFLNINWLPTKLFCYADVVMAETEVDTSWLREPPAPISGREYIYSI